MLRAGLEYRLLRFATRSVPPARDAISYFASVGGYTDGRCPWFQACAVAPHSMLSRSNRRITSVSIHAAAAVSFYREVVEDSKRRGVFRDYAKALDEPVITGCVRLVAYSRMDRADQVFGWSRYRPRSGSVAAADPVCANAAA